MKYCYLNGEIMPESEAKVGIFDIGLLRGFGIYEAMTAVSGQVFKYVDHIARFRRSAQFLNINIPIPDVEITRVMKDLIEKNGFDSPGKRVNIKFILTGGEAIGGIDFDPDKSTFYIFLEEWTALDPAHYEKGARLLLHEHLREYPEYKTINYISAVPLQRKMKSFSALETLYTWSGQVLECATSNFFIVQGGEIITTKDRILHGITRNVMIEVARANGWTVKEENISLIEAMAADECFISSSFKDIVPVVDIGGRIISDGKVGPVSKKMMQLFEAYLHDQKLAFTPILEYSVKT